MTCAMRDDEPRPVWMSLLITDLGLRRRYFAEPQCVFITELCRTYYKAVRGGG
jgi:hypothetical protein